MRKISKQLMAKQETQRQKTINLVLRAIQDLKNEGYNTEENQALKNECELLRGRLLLLMQRQSME